MTDIERSGPGEVRRLGALAAALGAGMALLFTYALHGAMKFNVVTLPLEAQVDTQRWLPQGWAFFTKDPQDERTSVYQRNDQGVFVSVELAPHGRPENAFGMDRASRAQGVEVGQLYERLRDQDYTTCEGPLAPCMARLEPQKRLQNFMPRKTLCGSIVLVRKKPLPWAWSAWEGRSHMKALAVRLEVQC